MKPAFTPKRVETKQPKGPRRTGAFPRYIAIGNAKRVARTREWNMYPGQVFADEDDDGNLIGIRIEE